MTWKEKQARVIRPNIECTNGIIHTIDTVMIDDAPPWVSGDSSMTLGKKALDKREATLEVINGFR